MPTFGSAVGRVAPRLTPFELTPEASACGSDVRRSVLVALLTTAVLEEQDDLTPALSACGSDVRRSVLVPLFTTTALEPAMEQGDLTPALNACGSDVRRSVLLVLTTTLLELAVWCCADGRSCGACEDAVGPRPAGRTAVCMAAALRPCTGMSPGCTDICGCTPATIGEIEVVPITEGDAGVGPLIVDDTKVWATEGTVGDTICGCVGETDPVPVVS